MKRDWWDKEFQIMMTLGESTTAGGWSSCRERCWASQLARMINDFQEVPVQLINLGIGANVISTKSPSYEYSGKPAANERLVKQVLNCQTMGGRTLPDLLIIAYGLNDARGGTPLDLFCNELKSLVAQVRQEIKPLIVLPGPYYINDFTVGGEHWSHADLSIMHKFNQAISDVATEVDCLYVNLLESYRSTDWLIHFDGVHANDLGHRIVANKIFEVLATNCSGLSLHTKKLEKIVPRWRDESTLQK